MTPPQATFPYQELDRVIHERARLAIMSSMIAHQGTMAFNDLKHSCNLTDGNLNRHLQVLQDAGFIAMNKHFEGTKPVTTLHLTNEGRTKFIDYITLLEQVVKDARNAKKTVNLSNKYNPKIIS